MPDVKLTPAQRRAAEEIDQGNVFWDRIDCRWRSLGFPPSVRSDVVERLVGMGIAFKGISRGMETNECVLTDLGCEVIANG